MTSRDELLAANEGFASRFRHGALLREPRRPLVVVTCMDARIDPLALLGLELGDANVLRNAGGIVTDDVLRSLALSCAVLGTREAVVIGHTDCGLHGETNDRLRALVGPPAGEADFLPFGDLDESVLQSILRIAQSGLLPDGFTASGYVYDVGTGRLRAVER